MTLNCLCRCQAPKQDFVQLTGGQLTGVQLTGVQLTGAGAHGASIVGIPVGYVQERETCVSCSSSVQLTVHPLSTSHSTPERHVQRHTFLRDRPTSSKKTQNVVRFGIVQRYSGTAYMVQSIVLLATVFTMIVSNHLKLLVIN